MSNPSAEIDLDAPFKPLEMTDGRVPCPRCGAKMDLMAEGLCRVWECPDCRRTWDEWEPAP